MNTPSGIISRFLRFVGMPPSAERDELFAELLVTLGIEWKTEEIGDDYGKDSAYWTFQQSGCILLWAGQQAITAFLYPRGDDEEGVDPFPGTIIEGLDVDSTKADVLALLGEPTSEGEEGEWVRYDGVEGNQLHIEFDDEDVVFIITVDTP